MTELDYGTLLCVATNRIGRQRVPCIYHVIAAGKLRKQMQKMEKGGALHFPLRLCPLMQIFPLLRLILTLNLY